MEFGFSILHLNYSQNWAFSVDIGTGAHWYWRIVVPVHFTSTVWAKLCFHGLYILELVT